MDGGRNVANRGGGISVTLMMTSAAGERIPGTHCMKDGG